MGVCGSRQICGGGSSKKGKTSNVSNTDTKQPSTSILSRPVLFEHDTRPYKLQPKVK